jgi:hypothetical protein
MSDLAPPNDLPPWEADAKFRCDQGSGGRKRNPIWDLFWVITPYDKQLKRHRSLQCKKCNEKVEGRLERLKKHILHVCQEATESDKEQILSTEASALGDGGAVSGRPAKQRKLDGQSSISSFFRPGKVVEEQKKALDAKVLRFFATGGIAWVQAASIFWIDLICSLCPGYVPPGMLTKVASTSQDEQHRQLRGYLHVSASYFRAH